MNIKLYILEILVKIRKLNSYISIVYKNKYKYNPFLINRPKTYVWIDVEKNL